MTENEIFSTIKISDLQFIIRFQSFSFIKERKFEDEKMKYEVFRLLY